MLEAVCPRNLKQYSQVNMCVSEATTYSYTSHCHTYSYHEIYLSVLLCSVYLIWIIWREDHKDLGVQMRSWEYKKAVCFCGLLCSQKPRFLQKNTVHTILQHESRFSSHSFNAFTWLPWEQLHIKLNSATLWFFSLLLINEVCLNDFHFYKWRQV